MSEKFAHDIEACQVLMTEHSATTVLRLSPDPGGSASLIVFDDAHLDKLLDDLIAFQFRERLTRVCSHRSSVFESTDDEFTAKLVKA